MEDVFVMKCQLCRSRRVFARGTHWFVLMGLPMSTALHFPLCWFVLAPPEGRWFKTCRLVGLFVPSSQVGVRHFAPIMKLYLREGVPVGFMV